MKLNKSLNKYFGIKNFQIISIDFGFMINFKLRLLRISVGGGSGNGEIFLISARVPFVIVSNCRISTAELLSLKCFTVADNLKLILTIKVERTDKT